MKKNKFEYNHKKFFKDIKQEVYPFYEKGYHKLDVRDTYNMDDYMIASLYEHMKLYKKVTCVNLDYHVFIIDGVQLTQGECIDRIIDDCKFILNNRNCLNTDEEQKEIDSKMRDALKVLAEIFWCMWW